LLTELTDAQGSLLLLKLAETAVDVNNTSAGVFHAIVDAALSIFFFSTSSLRFRPQSKGSQLGTDPQRNVLRKHLDAERRNVA
jgi:hypothetical protein